MASFFWPSTGSGSGGGVTSLNAETGDIILVAGTGITITPSGQNITIATTALSAAITSINLDTTAAQTLIVGTAGTDFAIVDAGSGSHVFNLPTASATNRGALSSADWSTFNGKQAAGSYITSLTGGVTASGPGAAAATVVTNANLTGPITSVGNATSIASQTGTGSTFVMNTAPTMTNPVVGTQSQGDASTKAASTAYVDTAVANAVAGINPAVAVQAATTSAANTSGLTYNNGVSGVGATFTGTTNTAIVIDGFTFTALGQRLLVKNDTQSPSGAFNGVYYVTQIQTSLLPPILTRALDYDTPSDINNTGAIPVVNGTVNGTTSWVQTAQIVTVGTTPLVFAQFSQNPANYLLVANNLSDVATKATAFNNISPMTTGGDLIYGGASGAGTRLANGTAGQVLQSNGTTLAPTWVANPAGAGNYYAQAYYPSSTSNYWSLTGSSQTDFTVVGTIPTPSTFVNSGFGTISKATSSLPGVSFTAPRTGTIKFTVITAVNTNNSAGYLALFLQETTTSTNISSQSINAQANEAGQATIVGYFNATAASAYNFKLQGQEGTSSGIFLTSQFAAGAFMVWSMEYIN